MAQSARADQHQRSRFMRWLLEGHPKEMAGPHSRPHSEHTHSWWQVMCLTGVDYFSTLGYQPGIAALAAGVLSPVATLILVLLTLLGALPIYRRVAAESPHGEGSIAMLEHLLSWWASKLFVLVLLGFVATDFVITITLSASDATAHIAENPFTPEFLHHHEIGITLVLVTLLGAVFLKGFKEAIGLAVTLVGLYLLLNLVVIVVGLYEVLAHPRTLNDWITALFTSHGSPLAMIGVALLVFPKLALGLSGFETGVAVMPLVRGDPDDIEERPLGRIRNTRKLLLTAALTMSVFLIGSSLVTTLLIPPEAFQAGGEANGRALAYLAHTYLGDLFGTLYDISTICILWFAGASAMAGLLNIVPRYLPRYGMAPEWARAARPLVMVFIAVAFAIVIIFEADVNAQGGAYATGVLVLMSSAAVAVTLSAWRQARAAAPASQPAAEERAASSDDAGARQPSAERRPAANTPSRGLKWAVYGYGLITLVFFYTTVTNIIERPDGIKIAGFFILSIIAVSLISRAWRSTELRTERVILDEEAQRFITELGDRPIRLIANQLDAGDLREYSLKEKETREDTHLPKSQPVLFLEVCVADPSEFTDEVEVKGVEVGKYRILRAESSSVPNAIAALLLHLRDQTGKLPHVYFAWTEGNPIKHLLRFILFGEGDIAPLTREVLRKAERDPEQRPAVHVGG